MSLPMYVAYTDSIPVRFLGVLLNSSVPIYVAYTDSIPVRFGGILLHSSVCRDNKKNCDSNNLFIIIIFFEYHILFLFSPSYISTFHLVVSPTYFFFFSCTFYVRSEFFGWFK
jgi:hypothetical protein